MSTDTLEHTTTHTATTTEPDVRTDASIAEVTRGTLLTATIVVVLAIIAMMTGLVLGSAVALAGGTLATVVAMIAGVYTLVNAEAARTR